MRTRASMVAWIAGLTFGPVIGSAPGEPPTRAKIEIPAPRLTDEDKAEICALIDELQEMDRPPMGLASAHAGSAFAPLQLSTVQTSILGGRTPDAGSGPFLRLVELGPSAMPFLLEALSDRRPTKLEIGAPFGGMAGSAFRTRHLVGNPRNPRETVVRELPAVDEFLEGRRHIATIGDVCLTILGQITGRGYSAARGRPSACVDITSPTRDPEIARVLREAWTSDNPAQLLLDTFMLDFRSGPQWQCSAAARLLYYFPEHSARMIADRLDSLRVDAPEVALSTAQYCVVDGVNLDKLLPSVVWYEREPVHGALIRIIERTDNPGVLLEALPAVRGEDRDLVIARMSAVLASADELLFKTFYDLNLMLACHEHAPWAAEASWQLFARTDDVERRTHVCFAAEIARPAWAINVLGSMLDDQRVAYVSDESGLPVRVCDYAAEAILICQTGEVSSLRIAPMPEREAAIERLKRVRDGDGAANRPRPDGSMAPEAQTTAAWPARAGEPPVAPD